MRYREKGQTMTEPPFALDALAPRPARRSWPARFVVPVTYWLVATFARIAVRVYLPRLRVAGLERVPRTGPLIVVSNHLDYADPCVLLGVLPRRVVFLTMKKMFGWPILGLLPRMLGALPVDARGPTIETMRASLHALREGRALVVFPEGERGRGGLIRGMAGAARLAQRTGAPVVPVAITGTERVRWPWVLLRPLLGPRVTVTVGEPFTFPRPNRTASRSAQDAIDDVMRRIAALLPVRYRGAYADVPASSRQNGDPPLPLSEGADEVSPWRGG